MRKHTIFAAICILFLSACNSPEESAQNHLQKGKELFEKGEFDKALLELKTSNQDDKRGETYYLMALLDEKHNNFRSMRENLLRTLELDPNMTDARLKLGKVDVLFGDLGKAMEQAEAVLAAKPDSIEAKLLKASIFLRQDKNDEASQIINAVLVSAPDNLEALFLKIGLHLRHNEIDQALDLLNTGLQKDSKNISLRMTRIRVNAGRKNTDAMVKDYDELIKLYPDADDYKLRLAALYSMIDRWQDAEGLLRGMVDKSPGQLEPKVLLLSFLDAKYKERVPEQFNQWLTDKKLGAQNELELSRWMLSNGYGNEAEKGLKQIADTEKDSTLGLTAQALLGEIALSKKQYDVVAAVADGILKANSDFVDASLLKARLLLSQNKLDEAIELLNKAIWSKNNTGDAYLLLGQAYAAKKDAKQAEKNYKQALEINPANLGAFFPVYNSYMQINQRETARQLLEKALKVKPNQDLLLGVKAESEIEEKKWDEAEATVQHLAMFSKNRAVPAYLEANILQGKGQYADAVAIYQKLLQERPDHLNSMVNLARSYEGLKSRDKAIAFLEAHHNKYPDNLTVVGVLGELYVANHDFAKARQLINTQLEHMPHTVSLYLDLARVEAVLRKSPESAKQIYLKGLENNPDDFRLSMALAGWYEQTGDNSSAETIYERLLKKYPESDVVVNNLASLLIESSDTENINKGLQLAEKFKSADRATYQDTYAWALVRTGQTVPGLKILEALIVREPKVADFRYHLAVAHFNSGNKATAAAEVKHALSLAEKQHVSFAGMTDAKKLLQELDQPSKK